MTDEPERPTGSHRRSNRSARLRVLLGSVVLAVIVALGVTWALHWRGEGSRLPRPTAASTTGHPPSTSTGRAVSSSPSTTTASSTSPAPSTAAGSPSAPTLVFTKPTPTPTPTATATPSATAVARPPVDVLNDSRIVGLAARAARSLRSAGWQVEKTGNYAHTIGSTTVYYPAGQLPAAQLLASQFPKIAEVLPVPRGLSVTHLTLVLTKDWSSSGG